MAVCAVQVDSPLRGFLVYAAMFFTWKLVVDLNTKKIVTQLKELDLRREEYFNLYKSIVKNDKEKKIRGELAVQIDELCKRRWSEKVATAANKFNEQLVREGISEFESATIIEKLERRYFLNSEDADFEEVFEFMTSPNRLFKREIDRMTNEKFTKKILSITGSIKRDIGKEIQRSIKVLEILKANMCKGETDNQSILNDFRVFFKGNNKRAEFIDKEVHLNLISRVAFDMILG